MPLCLVSMFTPFTSTYASSILRPFTADSLLEKWLQQIIDATAGPPGSSLSLPPSTLTTTSYSAPPSVDVDAELKPLGNSRSLRSPSLTLHPDALAVAGQGIVCECLGFHSLPAFSTGGTIHSHDCPALSHGLHAYDNTGTIHPSWACSGGVHVPPAMLCAVHQRAVYGPRQQDYPQHLATGPWFKRKEAVNVIMGKDDRLLVVVEVLYKDDWAKTKVHHKGFVFVWLLPVAGKPREFVAGLRMDKSQRGCDLRKVSAT
ncbi:hypothetical protein QBC45DRAFT_485479 [Copromyces sp. CBS 386.78]|nr:hypothetical protein QBC45DRAFT_485479 [Copromyces sp. CBS 386.78]